MDTHKELIVEGMTCSSCAMSVSNFLSEKGLENINVNLESGRVSFENPENVDQNQISKGIRSLGYSVNESNTRKRKNSREFWFFLSMLFTVPLLLHMIVPWKFLHNPILQFTLCLPVVIIGLRYFGKSAIGSVKSGQANMDVLILMGALSAFIYSSIGTFFLQFDGAENKYLFFETAASIISLVMLGNIIESRAVGKTRTAIEALIRMQPKKAMLLSGADTEREKVMEIDASRLLSGDVVLVNSGDQIPADGSIVNGNAKVDESAMTGESEALNKTKEDKVLSGTIVVDGSIKVKVSHTGKNTALAKIIKMMQDAQLSKPAIQKLADKISAWFVPVVILIALLTFLISFAILKIEIGESLMRSIAVLVISCPCAMGLATPTAIAVGIGRAGKRGLLIKDPNALELIDRATVFFFDKTGTLTSNKSEVDNISVTKSFSENEIFSIISSVELHSSHQIAKVIREHLNDKAKVPVKLINVEEIKGKGMKARTEDGREILLGSNNFTGMQGSGDIFLMIDNAHAATVFMKVDRIKQQAHELIAYLKSNGIKTVLLSGDKKEKCDRVALELGIDETYSEQLPGDKLQIIRNYNKREISVMVGDGINDAPPLETANIGISINDATQIAINAADIIITGNSDLSAVAEIKKIGKHTYLTIRQNLLWALLYNVVAIPLAAAGYLSPIVGVITMAFSDLIVIGNSIRLKTKKIF